MRIINAVYQLSEIQRTRGETRTQSTRLPRQVPSFPADSTPAPDKPPKQSAPPREEILSLPEMLHQHFVDEVRQRDRDQDGRLSRREFGGSREEFNTLDRTGKGYVSAKDLTREALARNPELRDIIAGPWTPVYEALIQVKDSSDESLAGAVREGAARVADQIALREGQADNPPRRDEQIASVTADFIMNHRELSGLYDRLQTLADRLGRYRRYAPVDLVG